MLPQIAGGKADCVEMLWRLALEMRIAVGKDMRAVTPSTTVPIRPAA